MAIRGQALTLVYTAWDTAANAPKTGDGANHTLKWIKDGSEATLGDTTPTELSNGEYAVDVTAAETDCGVGVLNGSSSTGDVVIVPVKLDFQRVDYLPTVHTVGSVVEDFVTSGNSLVDAITFPHGSISPFDVTQAIQYCSIEFLDGDCVGQERLIFDYTIVDSNGLALCMPVFAASPSIGDKFIVRRRPQAASNLIHIAGSDLAGDNLADDYTAGVGFSRPNSTIGTVTTVTNKVTPIDVDEITFESGMEIVLAVLSGVAEVTDNGDGTFDVSYKKRDGTTSKVTITFGPGVGVRTASVIDN